MPIVTRLSRNLSPLEEEPQCRSEGGREEGGGGGGDLFVAIGTCILSTRSCEPREASQSSEAEGSAHRTSIQESEPFLPMTTENLSLVKTQMQHLWSEGVPMCIEVKGQATPTGKTGTDQPSLLLEQWNIQAIPKRPSSPNTTSPQFLLQAVQSFLHFSQLRSWMISCGGTLPFDLLCRVCAAGDESWEHFTLCRPESHSFPAAVLSPHCSLQVTVTYLPRMKHVPPELLGNVRGEYIHPASLDFPVKMRLHSAGVKLSPPKVELMDEIVKRTSALSISSASESIALGKTRELHTKEGFPFSPPHPSPMSPKLLSGLADKLPSFIRSVKQEDALHCGSKPLQRVGDRLKSEAGDKRSRLEADREHACSRYFCFERTCVEQDHDEESKLVSGVHRPTLRAEETASGASPPVRYRRSCAYPGSTVGENTMTTTSGWLVRPPAGENTMTTTSGWLVRPPAGENTMTTTSGWLVRPPAASSPIPFGMRSERKPTDNVHRRSCAINIKHPVPPRPPLRSNSAPAAVPSLCLLGTFEESVLNGRLEPYGYVEGFTAEIGASGSFCPRHVTLPVTAAFFNLSDARGTSPYLGHIALSGVGKRGYHVPKKGTVQVTLFNPNKTVVKIYVVTYDLRDMPPTSQTFLRQRTLSRPYHAPSAEPHTLPALHYLIHLRFLCSKSGRVYLHTDIRLIFARRAPDTDPDLSKVSLYTITEGPTDPKYGPLGRTK